MGAKVFRLGRNGRQGRIDRCRKRNVGDSLCGISHLNWDRKALVGLSFGDDRVSYIILLGSENIFRVETSCCVCNQRSCYPSLFEIQKPLGWVIDCYAAEFGISWLRPLSNTVCAYSLYHLTDKRHASGWRQPPAARLDFQFAHHSLLHTSILTSPL